MLLLPLFSKVFAQLDKFFLDSCSLIFCLFSYSSYFYFQAFLLLYSFLSLYLCHVHCAQQRCVVQGNLLFT